MRNKMLIVVLMAVLFAGCDLTGEDTKTIATETQKVAGHIEEAATAVGKVTLTGDQLADLLEQANAGVAATAPWNPYAAPIQAGLGLVSIILAAFLKKKAGEAKLATNTLGAVVSAIENTAYKEKKVTGEIKSRVADELSMGRISLEGRNLITRLK